MRAARDQAKTEFGNLQLCTGLEASIEGALHAVGEQQLEILRQIKSYEEVRGTEEETESLVAVLGNLNIETAGTEDEASEGLEAALRTEIEEEGEAEGEGEEGGEGTQGALGDLEFLTQ